MILSNRFRSFASAWLLGCAALNVTAQNQSAGAAVEDTVKLPDLKVTTTADLPPPEAWQYTRVGPFEVISNASERTTRSLLADFAKFTHAMSLVWPAPLKPMATSTLILCGKGGKFDAFAPTGTLTGDAIVPSLFLRNREQVAIVIDVESSRVAIDPSNMAIVGASLAEYEVDHYQQLYRQYVRYLLSQSQAKPPVWLEEGLAQLIMDIELDDRVLIYGKIETRKNAPTGGESFDTENSDPSANTDAVVGEQPFNAVLRHRKLIPMEKFLSVTADSPEAKSPLGNNVWAKQAYAFVHFCMFGENLRHQAALGTFVTRLGREPLSEALFKDCFKVSYREMQEELEAYLRRTKHKYQKYPLTKDDKFSAKSIELREATTAEVGLIKGDALRLGGHPNEAYAAYRGAYLRGSREPALLAGMGAAEVTLEHPDRARELLGAAVKGGTKLPSAYLELARLRLAQATAQPAAKGKLSVPQMSSVLTPLFEARKYTPQLPDTYVLIAEAWTHSSVPAKPDNLGVLDEGIRAFPRERTLLLRAIDLYAQAGEPATAASIAKLGARFSTDPAAKAEFEKALAALPPLPTEKR